MRFFYKTKEGTGLLNLKSPDYDNNPDYERITEEEFEDLIKETK